MTDFHYFATWKRRRPTVPIPNKRTPIPISQGKKLETPVKASDEEPLPSVDESPEPPPEPPSVEPGEVDTAAVVVVDESPVVVVVVVGELVVVVESPTVVVVVGDVVVVVDVVPEAVVNSTVTGMPVRATLSVVSVAVYVTVSAVESVTVKRAFPELSLVPLTVVTVESPPDAARVTVFPGTASPFPSYKRTEMVEVVDPSPGTLAGVATTEQNAATGGGAGGFPNVTTACCVRTVLASVTSVAS
jgi:hypothetical protein